MQQMEIFGQVAIGKTVPYCNKIGITCASNGNMIGVQLPNMTLTGTIIEELALLKHLEVVDLSDNSLHRTILSMLGVLPLEGEEYPFSFDSDSPIGDSTISWDVDNYFPEHSTVDFVSEKEERSSLSSATSFLEITKAKMAPSSGSITKVSRKSNASVSTIIIDTSSSADVPRGIWMDVPKMT